MPHLGKQGDLIRGAWHVGAAAGPDRKEIRVSPGRCQALHDLAPRTVGWRLCQVVAVPGQHLRAARLGFVCDHADQGGLANAGFAADQHQPPTPLQRRLEAVAQGRLLAGAPG